MKNRAPSLAVALTPCTTFWAKDTFSPNLNHQVSYHQGTHWDSHRTSSRLKVLKEEALLLLQAWGEQQIDQQDQ